jgi:hypothetical protein
VNKEDFPEAEFQLKLQKLKDLDVKERIEKLFLFSLKCLVFDGDCKLQRK